MIEIYMPDTLLITHRALALLWVMKRWRESKSEREREQEREHRHTDVS